MAWTQKLKSIVGTIAPLIGSAMGGPAGGIVTKFLSENLLDKPDGSEDEIETYISKATPDQLIRLKELDNEWKMYAKKLDLDAEKIHADANAQQVELNKIEASSKSLFVSGWRPFLGWICGSGVGYAALGQPILVACGVKAPVTDVEVLVFLLTSILGLAGYRTYERKNGVANSQ